MFFELRDGRPVWAVGKVTLEKECQKKDESGEWVIQTEPIDIYLFDVSELAEYPDAELLEQPTPEMLSRAAEIAGSTLSKSEFERLLNEKTLSEEVEQLKVADLDNKEAIVTLYEMILMGGM